MSRRILVHQKSHDGLLGMETVFRFVEDLLGMAFEDFFGDLFVSALDVPLTPGGDDGHIRCKTLDGQLEAHLVVALAGAAMADGVGVFLLGDLHQAFADDGPGESGPGRYCS